MDQTEMTRNLPRWLLGVAVALLAAGVYANSIANGFALDDEAIIVKNERAHGVEKVPEAISSPYWPGVPPELGLYRPVAVATFAVDWDLWDGSPHGFHAVNVALHAAVSALVFVVLGGLGAPAGAAAFGAAVFAVHPVHTEAVANVVGRAELLACFFFLIALLAYLRRGLHPAVRLPLLAFAFLLALGSKEIAVTLPLILLLLEASAADPAAADPPRRGRARELVRRIQRELPAFAALAAAAAAYVLLRFAALGTAVGNDTAPFLAGLTTEERLATATRVWPEYFRLLLFPRDLVADYSPGVIFPLESFDVRSAIGILLAGLALAVAVLAWRRNRLLAIGILWFPITVFPVSNLLVTVGVVLAERTLYLPSVAVALAAAGVAVELRGQPARVRRLALAAAVVLIAVGGWWSWRRNPVWRSTDTLIAELAESHPESFRIAWVLAQRALDEGDVERSMAYFDRIVQVVPDYWALLALYGQTLVVHGRAAQAEPILRRAIALIPEHTEPYVYLSQALLNQGRYDEAADVIAAGLARADTRTLGGLLDQLAYAREGLGNWAGARAARRLSLKQPGVSGLWQRWRHLAELELRLGDADAAADALARARELAPDHARDELTPERLRADAAL